MPLSHLLSDLTVQLAAVAPIHALPQSAGIGMAVVMGVIGGVGVRSVFLVGAVHSVIPFLYIYTIIEIVTSQHIFLLQFCYKIAGRPRLVGAVNAIIDGA